MDRVMLLRHLALAEEHVQLGARVIARQQEIIEELDADGHNTVEARRMLKNFEQTQALHLDDRERIKEELARGKK